MMDHLLFFQRFSFPQEVEIDALNEAHQLRLVCLRVTVPQEGTLHLRFCHLHEKAL